MALEPGTRFGSYQISEPIGSGGMGEVYLARDLTLGRDVAIKVLPESFAADSDRIARFAQEAKTLAALNHVNIAQVYGLEKSDQHSVIVMELVAGPTLADRISQGPIPPDEALNIAMQIANALEAAHSKQIVHRDLKPANIKLTPDGLVKLLDFGIAKMPDAANAASGSRTPTLLTPALTEAGILLGTAAYMAPEQAKGRAIDQRVDIWAFGCVLCEMLTGQPVFAGEDVTTTLARVLEREADLRALPDSLSPAARHTIALCLRKDPNKRIADIRDVKLGLTAELAPESTAPVRMAGAHTSALTRIASLAAAVVVGASAAAVIAWQSGSEPAPLPVTVFSVPLTDSLDSFVGVSSEILAVAPDGERFAYLSPDGVRVRSLDELEPRLLPGTEDLGLNLMFSPDGERLAYFNGGEFGQILVDGGPAVVTTRIRGTEYITGSSWAADGAVYFADQEGIKRIRPSGGESELVLKSPDDGTFFTHPVLLPDGDSLLLTQIPSSFLRDGSIVVYSLSSGELTHVLDGGGRARYLPTGHLVFSADDRIEGVPFDLKTLAVTGPPVTLVQGVTQVLGWPSAHFGVSDNGVLVYLTGGGIAADRTFVWVDRDGREEPIAIPPSAYVYPRLSPDGTKIALDDRDENGFTWIFDIASETNTLLTTPGRTQYEAWKPDGEWLAYTDQERAQIYWRRADNTGESELLVAGVGQGSELRAPSPYFFTPDGTALVFRNQDDPVTNDDIGMMTVGEDDPTWLLNGPANERNAELSPDGRWMAYESDESGRFEIYVRRFPEMDRLIQVSNAGGEEPVWSRESGELFYIEPAPTRRMMSVTFAGDGDDLRFQRRTAIMDWPYVDTANEGRHYDVAPDGRFIALTEGAGAKDSAAEFVVIRNWTEELKRKVPTIRN